MKIFNNACNLILSLNLAPCDLPSLPTIPPGWTLTLEMSITPQPSPSLPITYIPAPVIHLEDGDLQTLTLEHLFCIILSSSLCSLKPDLDGEVRKIRVKRSAIKFRSVRLFTLGNFYRRPIELELNRSRESVNHVFVHCFQFPETAVPNYLNSELPKESRLIHYSNFIRTVPGTPCHCV